MQLVLKSHTTKEPERPACLVQTINISKAPSGNLLYQRASTAGNEEASKPTRDDQSTQENTHALGTTACRPRIVAVGAVGAGQYRVADIQISTQKGLAPLFLHPSKRSNTNRICAWAGVGTLAAELISHDSRI